MRNYFRSNTMKGILFLGVALLFSTGAVAYHGTEPEGLPPMPVQQCYQQAQVYQKLIVQRLAGMTLEETLMANEFVVRVSRYVIEANGHDPAEADEEAALIDEIANDVYEIPEDQINNQPYLQEYVTAVFDECVATIPFEASPSDDTEAIDRMLMPDE